MSNTDILIVEDEPALASALGSVCTRTGMRPRLTATGKQALGEARQNVFGMAILDIGLPDTSGLDLLQELRKIQPALPVVVITAHGNLENAVAAKKLGASAYLVKPLDLAEVQSTLKDVRRAAEPPGVAKNAPTSVLIGSAPAMQRCFIEIAQACGSEAPVLISGPTGTGKTRAARVIHDQSGRKDGPFATLHCGALPEPLLESELFGHERHAFTGASMARTGHLERADGGTLFLDEIADISPGVQARLLRVVEEKSFSRVGGREDLQVDLRLITATNRNLREEVHAGRFREDLFYRLHVLSIAMPPLQERLGDLAALAAFLLAGVAPGRGLQLSAPALEVLERYDWPGNVRELRNVLEHASAVVQSPVILPQHLPVELRELAPRPANESERALDRALGEWLKEQMRLKATYRQIHDQLEAMSLRHLLAHYDGKPTVLARELQMNRVTLRRRRKAYDEGAEG